MTTLLAIIICAAGLILTRDKPATNRQHDRADQCNQASVRKILTRLREKRARHKPPTPAAAPAIPPCPDDCPLREAAPIPGEWPHAAPKTPTPST